VSIREEKEGQRKGRGRNRKSIGTPSVNISSRVLF